MSPLKRWSDAFRLAELRLPADPDELEIICCDWDTGTVSHIGIEKANCKFNSPALQALRRRHPGPQNPVATFRWNKDSMRCVWVQDDISKEWFEVPNTDPAKVKLSAAEVALEKKINNLPGDLSVVVSQVKSRKLRQTIADGCAAAGKTRSRNNAMRKLGVEAQPTGKRSGATATANAPPASPPASTGTPSPLGPPPASSSGAPADAAPTTTAENAPPTASTELPMFNIFTPAQTREAAESRE